MAHLFKKYFFLFLGKLSSIFSIKTIFPLKIIVVGIQQKAFSSQIHSSFVVHQHLQLKILLDCSLHHTKHSMFLKHRMFQIKNCNKGLKPFALRMLLQFFQCIQDVPHFQSVAHLLIIISFQNKFFNLLQ